MIQAWWFRFLVRAGLVLLAFGALWFAHDRYVAFRLSVPPGTIRPDDSLWLLSVMATIVARLLFALAASLPFTTIRYLPSRLLLAAVALVPVALFWWIIVNRHLDLHSWLWRYYWFDDSFETSLVLAALAGVAIASGFRAKQ